MAADLDRAYVINGDDLRIALTGIARKPFVPSDVAASILGEHARPLDGTLIRVGQLAAWFREHEFAISVHTGDSFGKATHPGALAETILEDITGRAHPMPAGAETHYHRTACTCPWPGEPPEAAAPEPARTPIVLHMGDTELSAMGCILAVFEDLDGAETRRVLRWACDRHGVGTR